MSEQNVFQCPWCGNYPVYAKHVKLNLCGEFVNQIKKRRNEG